MNDKEIKAEAEKIVVPYFSVQKGRTGALIVDDFVALCLRVREDDAQAVEFLLKSQLERTSAAGHGSRVALRAAIAAIRSQGDDS